MEDLGVGMEFRGPDGGMGVMVVRGPPGVKENGMKGGLPGPGLRDPKHPLRPGRRKHLDGDGGDLLPGRGDGGGGGFLLFGGGHE